ncbi:YeeE/YedE family protein [Ramlibacter terrae]|uniref:YeeE/YedE family protein n=1 Tax=Ramlibacter terrae TaxID=2732511 RepID=A0ABX6P349_9BURK|nr:YeeE/YedE family protein [Ramlibacter terrae]
MVAKGDWIGGVAVGGLVAAALFLTGNLGFLAEHPETLEPAWLGTQSRRPEGLSFAAPMAHALDLLTLWTDKSMVATFGVMLALGVLVGSAVSAALRGEFKLESFRGPREIGEHVAGGVLMGFGGITALGCSVGNGVTGMAMLSSGALIATAGIVAGAGGRCCGRGAARAPLRACWRPRGSLGRDRHRGAGLQRVRLRHRAFSRSGSRIRRRRSVGKALVAASAATSLSYADCRSAAGVSGGRSR